VFAAAEDHEPHHDENAPGLMIARLLLSVQAPPALATIVRGQVLAPENQGGERGQRDSDGRGTAVQDHQAA
jgi:hypothetical protein